MNDLFPKTSWNEFIQKINWQVIALDGNKEEQKKFIYKVYYGISFSENHMFDKYHNILGSWLVSQLRITGFGDEADMHEHMNSSMRFYDSYGMDFIGPEKIKEIRTKLYGEDYYREPTVEEFEDAVNRYEETMQNVVNKANVEFEELKKKYELDKI